MAEGVAPYYTLKNNGYHGNCTLTALFPAAISVVGLKVGETTKLNYDVSIILINFNLFCLGLL
jgi:hypothetical protein